MATSGTGLSLRAPQPLTCCIIHKPDIPPGVNIQEKRFKSTFLLWKINQQRMPAHLEAVGRAQRSPGNTHRWPISVPSTGAPEWQARDPQGGPAECGPDCSPHLSPWDQLPIHHRGLACRVPRGCRPGPLEISEGKCPSGDRVGTVCSPRRLFTPAQGVRSCRVTTGKSLPLSGLLLFHF